MTPEPRPFDSFGCPGRKGDAVEFEVSQLQRNASRRVQLSVAGKLDPERDIRDGIRAQL